MKKEKTTPTEAPQLKPEISEVQPEPQKSVKQSKIMKVGAMLKEMRLQKDLKLNDVSKQLCIRKHYLESIEESAYGDIPPLPYGIGFIRSYAKFLGLNSENIVDLYKEETHISEPTGMHVLEPQAEASVPSFYYLVISVAAIALLSVGWLVYNRSSSPVEESVVEYNDTSDNGGVIVVEEFSTEQLVPEAPAVEEEPSVQEEQPQVKVTEEVYQEP